MPQLLESCSSTSRVRFDLPAPRATRARLLELFEVQNEQGPCLDCSRSGEAITNVPLDPGDRWPLFAAEARRMGFAIVHAIPMRLRGQILGAMNVFSTNPSPIDDETLALGQALADIATVGLVQQRTVREAQLLGEQLQSALQSRVVIEQAKGIVAERRQVDMGAAFELIRGHARSTGTKLSVVAEQLVTGRLTPRELLPRR